MRLPCRIPKVVRTDIYIYIYRLHVKHINKQNEWKNTNFMSNVLKNANFNIECDCTRLWTDEVFVLADRHRTRYEIETRVMYGCLKQILSWSHSKMLTIKGFTAKKSVVLNDEEPRPIPISKVFAHLMIRKIDEAYIEFQWMQQIHSE